MPRDVFKNTGKKYWFKCGVCNHDFVSSLDHIVAGRWCPTRVFKTEKKFKNYLTNSKNVLFYIKFIHKCRPVWANLKKTHGTSYEYDFYIEFENDLKIIVEIIFTSIMLSDQSMEILVKGDRANDLDCYRSKGG